MARDRQRQLEAAARIRDLRGTRPQPVIADAVGVSLRTYQHWEEGDGIGWENLQKLAAYHGVSENYLLYGQDVPIGPQTAIEERLSNVEAQLAQLLTQLAGGAPPAPPGELGRSDPEKMPSGGTGPRKRTRKAGGSR